MASGGPRKPQKPAPVSGPGKFAQRTDGGVNQPVRKMTGGEYGDNQELATLQGSAPMNASGRMPQGEMEQAPPPQASPVPFDAPSGRPDEPVTAGNPFGPGPGASPLGVPQYSAQKLSALLRQVADQDVDGSLDALIASMESNGL